MKKKSNVVIICFVAIWIVFCILFSILYYNFPFVAGSINLVTLLISNTVVITIFVITYFVIDKRNIRVYDNKKKVALTVLNDTYDRCTESISMLEDNNIRRNAALKINGNTPIGEEKTLLQIHNYPFTNDNLIVQFAIDGILSNEQYKYYYKVKSAHWRYVYHAVAFYDYYHENEWVQNSLKELRESIKEAKASLTKE